VPASQRRDEQAYYSEGIKEKSRKEEKKKEVRERKEKRFILPALFMTASATYPSTFFGF